MHPHSIEWLVIPAPDIKAACQFYHQAFGFETTPHTDAFHLFKTTNINGAFDATLTPSPNSMTFSITVKNMTEAVNHVTQAGGKILKPPYPLPQNLGTCCQCEDPNGQTFELYSAP